MINYTSHPQVRLYGDVAVSIFTEIYDALIHGERRSKTIISTDTFIKRALGAVAPPGRGSARSRQRSRFA